MDNSTKFNSFDEGENEGLDDISQLKKEIKNTRFPPLAKKVIT